MANQSIYAAFERMWHHIITKMEAKSAAHVEYTDRAVAQKTQVQMITWGAND